MPVFVLEPEEFTYFVIAVCKLSTEIAKEKNKPVPCLLEQALFLLSCLEQKETGGRKMPSLCCRLGCLCC